MGRASARSMGFNIKRAAMWAAPHSGESWVSFRKDQLRNEPKASRALGISNGEMLSTVA